MTIRNNDDKLSEKQIKLLTEYEQAIADSEFGTGKYFYHIKDEGLHKAQGTFEKYCQAKWGKSRVHVDRLIAAHLCVENLKQNQIGSVCLPVNGSQARTIASLPKENQISVAQAVQKSISEVKPTAKDFKTAMKELNLTAPKVAVVKAKKAKSQLKAGEERIVLITKPQMDFTELVEAIDQARNLVKTGQASELANKALDDAWAITMYFLNQLATPNPEEVETPTPVALEGGKIETM